MRIKTLLASAALVILLAVPAFAAPLLIQADRYEGNISKKGSAAGRTVLVLKYDAVTEAPVSYLETSTSDWTNWTRSNGTFVVKDDRSTGASRFTLMPRAAGKDQKFIRTYMGASLRTMNAGESGVLPPTGAQLLKNGREIMRFPSSYSGTIPAASGPGILLEVTFRADRTFRIAETYIDEPDGSNKFYESGRWSVGLNGKTPLLTLEARSGRRYFAIGDKSITMVDGSGRPAESKLNYTLREAKGGDLFNKPFLMEGEYSQTYETGIFRDAATGRRYLVAKGGGNAGLERAYSEKDKGPGEYLPALVTGSIVIRSGEDDQPEEMLLVNRLVALGIQETALVKGDWKIVSARVVPAPENPEGEIPFLKFDTDGRFYGYAGCNRIAGSYILSGMKLTLDGLLSTKMACRDMRLEDALLQALPHVRSYAVDKGVLILKGPDGKVLVKLTDEGTAR